VPRPTDATLAAIKDTIDIVSLVESYVPLHRAGSKFKGLCPFHDDHNPSMEVNPERQSYKCWSCGAGGDVFDFVMAFERVSFPEAKQLLAERAGVPLNEPTPRSATGGTSKADLLAVNAWAERAFRAALAEDETARAYLDQRGLSPAMIEHFGLGVSPDRRSWLVERARRDGIPLERLERAGLALKGREPGEEARDRFRGRLIFPIRDFQGRPIGFGARILPGVERRMDEAGFKVAKYLNTPETPLFQKRRSLYAADLARDAARKAGWVAVVEGYTDVIAAHQVGLENVVGTLGTALGDEHARALRRLADRVVLVFDGDEAGQRAADRGLELFLNHELDVRVLTLPAGVDPCDVLLRQGAEAFQARAAAASDPLDYAVDRASRLYNTEEIDGARRAADQVLRLLARVPGRHTVGGLSPQVAKALDRLSQRLRLPVDSLRMELSRLRQTAASRRRTPASEPRGPSGADGAFCPISPASLDALDRELVEILLNAPEAVGTLSTRVEVARIRDEPLRAIVQACFDLDREGTPVSFEAVADRLDDPAHRALAASLLSPIEAAPLPESDRARPAPWLVRLSMLLPRLAERDRLDRLREIQGVLDRPEDASEPVDRQGLWREKMRLLHDRGRLVAAKKSPDVS